MILSLGVELLSDGIGVCSSVLSATFDSGPANGQVKEDLKAM